MSDTQRRGGAPFQDPAHCPPQPQPQPQPGPPPRAAAGDCGSDWLTEYAAEVLLTVPPAGPEPLSGQEPPAGLVFADEYAARSALRLAGMLTAARETPPLVDPAREEAALAAYRAARHAFDHSRSARWRRAWRRTDHRPVLTAAPWRTRAAPRRVAAAALASVLALGGVTVAVAGAGRLLAPGGGAGSGPVSSSPAAVTPHGGTSGAPPTAASDPEDGQVPAPRSSEPGVTPPAQYSGAWCRDYLRGRPRGRVAAAPAVMSYCRHLVRDTAGKRAAKSPGKSPVPRKYGKYGGKKAVGPAGGGNRKAVGKGVAQSGGTSGKSGGTDSAPAAAEQAGNSGPAHRRHTSPAGHHRQGAAHALAPTAAHPADRAAARRG